VEEVPITEPKDYTEPDVFYDINKEGFEDTADAKEVYSFPVSAKLNLPEVTSTSAPLLTSTLLPVLLEDTVTTVAAALQTSTLPPVLSEDTVTTEAVQTTQNVLLHQTDFATATVNNNALLSTAADMTVGEQSWTTTAYVQPSISTATTASAVVTTNLLQTQFQDSTNRIDHEDAEVYLGVGQAQPDPLKSATTSDASGFEVIHIGKPTTDPSEEPLNNSAHKIPNSLWTAFEHSREHEDETASPAVSTNPQEATEDTEEAGTEDGLNLAGLMSFMTPHHEEEEHVVHPTIIDIEDLPKPDEHTSEVLLIEELSGYEEDNETEAGGHKLPKAFDFGLPDVQGVESGDVQIHAFGLEQPSPLRNAEGGAKKREEWVKNWVARKYSKPKFPRGPVPILSASQPDTTDAPAELFSEVIDINSKSPNGFFSAAFAPTIPPLFLADPTLAANNAASSPAANVNVDFKSSLLEKYSRNKIKNSLFHNKAAENAGAPGLGSSNNSSRGSETAVPAVVAVNRPSPVVGGVPLGANTGIHRSYGGKQLSQADFESQILGVSSATEISVRSMICVKGRCFNGDDMSKLIS